MQHTLKIGVGKETPSDGDRSPADSIVRCRKVDIRERLLRFLLGEKRRLTILVPHRSPTNKKRSSLHLRFLVRTKITRKRGWSKCQKKKPNQKASHF